MPGGSGAEPVSRGLSLARGHLGARKPSAGGEARAPVLRSGGAGPPGFGCGPVECRVPCEGFTCRRCPVCLGRRRRGIRTRRRRGRPSGRAKVGDMSHAGVLTHRGNARDSCGLVLKSFGHGHYGPVGCCQPESDMRLRVNEKFKQAGHRYPPGLRAPARAATSPQKVRGHPRLRTLVERINPNRPTHHVTNSLPQATSPAQGPTDNRQAKPMEFTARGSVKVTSGS